MTIAVEPVTRRASWSAQTLMLARRSLLGTVRQPTVWFPALVFPLLIAAVNSAALGRSTALPGFPAVESFGQFLLPGTLTQGVMFGGIIGGSGVALDIENGFFERLVASPVPRWSILVGRLSGSAILGAFQALIFVIVFVLFGATIEGGPAAVVVLMIMAMFLALAVGGFAATIGLRTGSQEAVQNMFPLLFVLVFFSSAFFPTALMAGWYQWVAERNPITWMIDSARDLVITGFDLRDAAQAIGVAMVLAFLMVALATAAVPQALGGDGVSTTPAVLSVTRRRLGVEGVTPVIGQLAYRGVLSMLRVPAAIIPVVVMPVFFVLAFSGAFGAIVNIPGFPTDNILNWMVPFAILQGAAFAGFGAAFGAGRDLENGFYDRLLLSPVPRPALVLGPLSYSAIRALLPAAIVLPVGIIGGARLEQWVLGIVMLLLAAVGVAIAAGLWGLGVTYRVRSQSALPLVQAGIFVAMFLSTGQVPIDVMTGWLQWVAERNPFTYVLQMARQGFIGEVTWAHTWPGLLSLAILWALLGVFTWRGFRRLVP